MAAGAQEFRAQNPWSYLDGSEAAARRATPSSRLVATDGPRGTRRDARTQAKAAGELLELLRPLQSLRNLERSCKTLGNFEGAQNALEALPRSHPHWLRNRRRRARPRKSGVREAQGTPAPTWVRGVTSRVATEGTPTSESGQPVQLECVIVNCVV